MKYIERQQIIKKVTKYVVDAIIEMGLPVAWQNSEAVGYFVMSRNRVIPLGEFKGWLGGVDLSLKHLRLDHLVNILEYGIRETDESNRYDDITSRFHRLEAEALEKGNADDDKVA